MKLVTILAVVLALFSACSAGQESALGSDPHAGAKFTVRANLVFLPTRVQKKNGDTIYGLKPEQFIVEDNGGRRSVQVDEDPDSSGLSLVVALQCGRSAVSEFHKLRGLTSMIDAITGGAPHEVSVISYGDQPYQLSGFSKSSGAVRIALTKLTSCGDYHAATIDAVDYAIRLLKDRPNHYRHAILLIGETRDHGSHAKLSDVVAELGVTDTVIYTVAFSPARDEFIDGFRNHPPKSPPAGRGSSEDRPDYTDHPPLFEWPPELMMLINALRRNTASELASLSGGEYINFTTQKGFENGLDRISNEIHNYYLLSFAPSTSSEPSLHTLRVHVPDYPDAVIQTRKNYWSGILESK
jgi:VWFA-related protein